MKIIPPSSSLINPDDSFRTGALVMYENDGSPFIGAVLGFKNRKYQVLNMRGREVELQALRMHSIGTTVPQGIDSLEKKSEFLLSLYERCHKEGLELNLEEIWGLTHDEGESFSSSDIGKLYYGKPTFEQQLTLRLALISDRIFFKRKGDEFAPRATETVEDLKKSEQAAIRKVKAQEITLNFFFARLKDLNIPTPEEALSMIHLLEDTAAGVNDIEHNRQKEAKEFMNLFCEKAHFEFPTVKERRAFAILEKIGHFNDNTNLALIRHRPPVKFSPAVLEEAKNLGAKNFEDKERMDCTKLWCVTIDDAVTKDMDDALSIEETKDGYTLGIHISDVAAIVEPDSILDKDARTRTTSLYLAGEAINMLPKELSEDKCSLLKSVSRPALSCFFDLDKNFKIKESRLAPTVVKVSDRLDYDTVSKSLETDNGKLLLLYQIAMAEEQRRIEGGAHKVTKKEVLFYPQENGEIEIAEIDENDPARSMVGELMVLANRFMAGFAAKNKIPVLYRGQDSPDSDSPPRDAPPSGPAADFAERSILKKSTVSFDPTPHSGLGLKAYIQATSPIRRYVDLCNQRQLLSFVRTGKPLYSRSEYEKIVDAIAIPLSSAGLVSKETRRYWLLRYLEQMIRKGEQITGTVVRKGDRTPLVELDKLYVTVFAKVAENRKLGDKVALRIEAIDARMDYLKLVER